MAEVREFNFDGIVGPTHNYSGLSLGNLASAAHRQQRSSPRAAALQGLQKMRFVQSLGVGQAVLPPLRRPRLDVLRRLGFAGSDAQVVDAAWKTSPQLLAACYSAASMWTANAATVSPAMDCNDGRTHLTPANLNSSLHRALEAEETTRVLRAVFADPDHFVVHDPLPANVTLSDEGAANHSRFYWRASSPGIELFVYGRKSLDRSAPAPQKFPARQTLEACQAIARVHGLSDSATLFAQQTPQAIDAGVFHNDVIAVGNQNVLLLHEQAFIEQPALLTELRRRFRKANDADLHVLQIGGNELSLQSAVSSYLFNSQLLTVAGDEMMLLCPSECESNDQARQCLERLLGAENPLRRIEFMDLRESMNNGGGPACLRLRVTLTNKQSQAIGSRVLGTPQLFDQLQAWIEKHYRDELRPDDLRDPGLIREVDAALEELSQILSIPADVLGL